MTYMRDALARGVTQGTKAQPSNVTVNVFRQAPKKRPVHAPAVDARVAKPAAQRAAAALRPTHDWFAVQRRQHDERVALLQAKIAKARGAK
jgi:hypothetical protein